MSALDAQEFEPAYIEPQGVLQLTEYGRRFMSARMETVEKCYGAAKDVFKLALAERWKWDAIEAQLRAEGVPTAISSGLSGYSMLKLLDHNNGKTSFLMPTVVAMALGTAGPTATTTGAWSTTESTNYTNYGRLAFTTTNWVAAAGSNPATSTYSSAGAVTFNACTGGTATETGFIVADSTTIGGGNALWYGSLSSVTISTTQTPPTLAQNALTVSLNGT